MSGNKENDFDIDFEEEISQDEEEQFEGMEFLPDPPTLGGKGYDTDIYGSRAKHIGGTASSPRLFKQASSFPEVTQMRVWKMENGTPSALGVISAEASEEDLIRQFHNAMPSVGEGSGRFAFRPLSIDGDELGNQWSIIINENHAELQRMNKSQAARNGQGQHPMFFGAGGGIPEGFLDVMKETLRTQNTAIEIERERTQRLMQQMAQERVDLATNTAHSVQTVSERMMEADRLRQEGSARQEQERNQQVQDAMSAFFQNNMEVLRTDRERQVENHQRQSQRDQSFYATLLSQEQTRMERDSQRSKSDAERMHQQFQMMLEQERGKREEERREGEMRRKEEQDRHERRERERQAEWERQERRRMQELHESRLREQQDLKEREKARQRQHELKMAEAERSAQRDREHAERMMQLQALQVQSDKQGSFKETIKETLSTLSEFGVDANDLVGRLFHKGGDQGGESSSMDMLGNLAKIASTAGDVLKAQKDEGVLLSQQNQLTQQAQVLQEERQRQMHNARLLQQAHTEIEIEKNTQQMSQGIVPPSNQQKEPEPPPKTVSSIPLGKQKSARMALRRLIQTLRRHPVPQWEDLITTAIVGTFEIYEYIQDVSVVYAMNEGGADEEMIAQIIPELHKHPMVPNDLNYGV